MTSMPMTAREYELAGRFVIQDCPECMTRSKIDPGLITLTFGDDFDTLMGLREIRHRFDCPHCGSRRPDIYFGDEEHPLAEHEAIRKTG